MDLKGLLLKTGKIIVGDGSILDNASIIIQGEKITEVGIDVDKKNHLEILDYSDRVVMPGIIDTHVHFCHDGNLADPSESGRLSDEYLTLRGSKFAEELLKFGVTTCGDAAARGNVSLAIREAIENGIIRVTL